MKAELIINGPRGQAYVEIYIEPDAVDGKLHPAYIEVAAAQALNIYNELPQPSFEQPNIRLAPVEGVK